MGEINRRLTPIAKTASLRAFRRTSSSGLSVQRALVIAGVVFLAGCGGGAAAAMMPAPVPVAAASAAPVNLTTLGDSITADGRYATALAGMLGARLTNLGVSGETSGGHPAFTAPNGGPFIVAEGGVLADQVTKIPLDSTIVTLYIGTNDVWEDDLLGTPDDQSAAAFATNLRAIVAGIRARVPAAQLAIATVPNGHVYRSRDPIAYDVTFPASDARRAFFRLAHAIKTEIVGTGATVVDLLCEPAMYDLADFPDPWDVHPNDTGHAVIARDFYNALKTNALSAPCKWETALV